MSNYSMITSAGLVAITEASPHGILIDVRYFLPVYDWRIDPLIQPTITGVSANDISSITDPSDTSPYGEIIWNTDDGYSLSDSENSICLISGSNTVFQDGVNADYVINPVQLQHQSINLYNNLPLSYTISATQLIYAPSAAGVSWILNNAVNFDAYNSRPVGDNSDFWNVVEYAPILAEDGTSRGCFKCRINKDVGQFKFNKIALYAVRLNSSYVPYGDPFLFAQAILPTPEIKSGLSEGGLEEFVAEIQIEVNSAEIDWNDLVIGSTNDYWQKVTVDGSLHHSRGVYIGKYAPEDTNNRLAKTIISTWENLGYGEDADHDELNKPQLALINVTESDNVKHLTTFRVNSEGNLVVGLSANNNDYPELINGEDYTDITTMTNVMILPEKNEKFFVGSKENRFKCYYGGLSGFGDFCGDYAGDVGEYNEPKNDLIAIELHGGGIQLGRSSDYNNSEFTYGVRLIDRSIKLEDRFFNNSHILGADLKMNLDQSLFIYTSKPNVTYEFNKETSGSNVFVAAGILDDVVFNYFTDYTTKENIESIFTSANLIDINAFFDPDAKMYLMARGGINVYSALKLFSNTFGTLNNYSIIHSHNYAGNDNDEKMLLIAGVGDNVFNSDIVIASESSDYSTILTENSFLELVGGKGIKFWGDISPVVEGNDDSNPLTIFAKTTSVTRSGFKIGKLLDITSCNAAIDNIRFYSFYEQPFARFEDLNLDFALASSYGYNIAPAWGQNNNLTSDIFKYAKWARIGNMIVLRFYLNLKFAIQTGYNAKLSFKLPSVDSNSDFDKNTELFEGTNNYLHLEVQGTNLTKFEDQDSYNPDVDMQYLESAKIYHPVDLIFSKDFAETSDPTETETKVLVPVYENLNSSTGQPANGNTYGTYPYDNPFATCSLRFYIRKNSYTIDLTALTSYLNSYPNGGNTSSFLQMRDSIDYLINANAKNSSDRSAEENYALSQFNFGFYSWDSFKVKLRSLAVSTDINKDNFTFHQGKPGGRYRDWSIKFATDVFKYDSSDIYTDEWNIVDGGRIFLKQFDRRMSDALTLVPNAIIKINYNQFGGKDEVAYFKLSPTPKAENYDSIDILNTIGTIEAGGNRLSVIVPMLKVYDMKTGQKRRWTFSTYGKVTNTIGTNSSSRTGLTINNNTW